MSINFFQGLMRWNIERKGTTGHLPYQYYDSLVFSAVYTASTSRVRQLIPHADLHPIELTPGRCLTSIAYLSHRRTEDEPYNEASISFLVSYRSRPLPLIAIARILSSGVAPAYVWQLPVTTEAARAGGVDLFALPKFLADIRIAADSKRVDCSLSLPGGELMRLSGPALPARRARLVRYLTYAVDGESLVTANTVLNAFEFAESWNGSNVELTIGNGHPLCDALREIRLANRPTLLQYIPHSEALLFPARNARDL
jgi:hypothetical protein